jgi:hypothetical protein
MQGNKKAIFSGLAATTRRKATR